MSHVKKTRRIFYLATAVTTVMGIAAACAFPEPELVPELDGGVEGGGQDGTDDTNGGDVIATDGGQPDAIELDAPLPFDATSDKPAVDAADGCCDCDDDGYLAKDAGPSCADAGKPQSDCDDLDPRANPDAGFVHDLPTLDTKGDWNCDGKYTLEWGPNTDCAKQNSGLLGSGGCPSIKGFEAAEVRCGEESSTWVECRNPGIVGACLEGPNEKRTQGCK